MTDEPSGCVDASSSIISPGEYLTKAADWLNEIAAKLSPCGQVDEIKRIGESIRHFKIWVDSYVRINRSESNAKIADLETQLKALQSQLISLERPASSQAASPTLVQATEPNSFHQRAQSVEQSEEAEDLEQAKQIEQAEEEKVTEPAGQAEQVKETEQTEQTKQPEDTEHDEEPDWPLLVLTNDTFEQCNQQEAAMVHYLLDKKGLTLSELHAWVMLVMGAIADSKNCTYQLLNIQKTAFARGGRTLVRLLKFEAEYELSLGIYEESTFEWNAEEDPEEEPILETWSEENGTGGREDELDLYDEETKVRFGGSALVECNP